MKVGMAGWYCSALTGDGGETDAYNLWCGGKSFEQCSNCISRKISVKSSVWGMKLQGGTVLFLDKEKKVE